MKLRYVAANGVNRIHDARCSVLDAGKTAYSKPISSLQATENVKQLWYWKYCKMCLPLGGE